MSTPAGWYADPDPGGSSRYWDGEQWTDARASSTTAPVQASDSQDRRVSASWKQRLFLVLAMVGMLALFQVGWSVYSWFTHPLAFPCCSAVPTFSVSRDAAVGVPLSLSTGAVSKRPVTITSISPMTYPSRLAVTITYTLCDTPASPTSDPDPVACANPRDPVGQMFIPGKNVLLVNIVAHESGTLQIHGTAINYREGRWRHGSQVTGGAVTINVA